MAVDASRACMRDGLGNASFKEDLQVLGSNSGLPSIMAVVV